MTLQRTLFCPTFYPIPAILKTLDSWFSNKKTSLSNTPAGILDENFAYIGVRMIVIDPA
jgi:hypothetical protein